ncbi:MAG: hypothetical protein AB7L09_03290 [Nitrospira sp.]
MQPTENAYKIHDNGGRPYTVRTVQTRPEDVSVTVYRRDGSPVMSWPNARRVFVPLDDVPGNTLLVHLRDDADYPDYPIYIWIGPKIYQFHTVEPVIEFRSPIGNSDVPYPYALTESWVYLMLERIALRRDLIPDGMDPYHFAYDHIQKFDNSTLYRVIDKGRF